jgi:hypothetical protein
MKQTALDYLLSELQNVIELYKTEWEELDSIVKKAEEMEWEQLLNAYLEGDKMEGRASLNDAEQYYKETFNTKEK